MRLIEKRTSGIQRYSITSHRTSSLHIIRCDGMIPSGPHTVRIVDVSIVGMGIESSVPIHPGLVCMEEAVSGHRFGVVNWHRAMNRTYRAGISFLTLPYNKERYILNQLKGSPAPITLSDPEKIIENLLKSMNRNVNG